MALGSFRVRHKIRGLMSGGTDIDSLETAVPVSGT